MHHLRFRSSVRFCRTLFTTLVILGLAAGCASAQKTKPQIPRAYDVCSVKLNSDPTASAFRPDPSGGLSTTIPTVGLVMTAFEVQDFQVFGLPGWATSDRYDVACKDTEAAVDKEQALQRMRSGIRALLADRFRLQYHRGAKPLPVATLTVRRGGLKLAPSQKQTFSLRYGPSFVKGEACTMAQLANVVTSLTRERVVDKTGLTGRYDLDLHWTPDEDSPLPDVPLLANLFNDQLGLTIKRTSQSTEVIIVDHIERPDAN